MCKPFFLLAFLLSLLFFQACKPTNENPNVVLILTDDQGWGDVAFHQNSQIETPQLDKLSSESIEFTRFYVSPVCAPTRASLLTGRYHLAAGTSWVTHRKEVMNEEEYTLAEMFRDNGYRTGLFGKWHNGKQYPHNPNGQGFEEFYGFTDGHLNNYFNSLIQHNNEKHVAEGYLPDYLTQKAIDFMQSQKDPFFCMITYNTPHSPFQVPDKYFEKYKHKGLNDKDASVYGMVENIDDNIGKLREYLKNSGKDENTIFIFLTDNGPNGARYNGGFKGVKGHVDEGGVRVPFVMKVPGYEPLKTDVPSAHIDVLPTLAKLAGLNLPEKKPLDGRDFSAALSGEELPDRMFFTHQVRRKLDTVPGAVRTNEFLLSIKPGDTALFNILEDPLQKEPLSNELLKDSLMNAYNVWFETVTANHRPYIPIQTGHEDISQIKFPAPDVKKKVKADFFGGFGWANDWLVAKDSSEISWDLKEVSGSDYQLVMEYTSKVSPEREIYIEYLLDGETSGSLKINTHAIKKRLKSPDRVKRGEVYEFYWPHIKLGALSIPKGGHTLSVKIQGEGSLEIKSLNLVQINQEFITYPEDTLRIMKTENLSYLALGDSYTIGEAVVPEDRFPEQLMRVLKKEQINVSTHHIVATTGWTVSELEEGIAKRDDLLESYDMVTLLIGVNDQYRGYPVEDYEVSFPRILQQALDFAGGNKSKLTVISIPDYAYTPFGMGKMEISEGIDMYNAVNKRVTEEKGIRYVDITPISRNGLNDPDLVAKDNLHPSGKQYGLWVNEIVR